VPGFIFLGRAHVNREDIAGREPTHQLVTLHRLGVGFAEVGVAGRGRVS
jgi:hypothetical protein